MKRIELKPCPCCGTEPYTHLLCIRDDELKGYVSCNNPKCRLKMEFTIKPTHILLDFNDVINGLYDVADNWNKREGEQSDDNKN